MGVEGLRLFDCWSNSLFFQIVLNKYMLFTRWEVHIGKKRARGRPRVVHKTESTVFPTTDRPWMANNILIFFLKPNKWLWKEPEYLWAGRMGRILPTLGTNQIAGFVEYRLLTNWEKNKYEQCTCWIHMAWCVKTK